MTKTIIAIGLGLLVAFFSPAKAVLAQTTGPQAKLTSADGSGAEAVEFHLSLVADSTVETCSAKFDLCLTFLGNRDKDEICQLIDLSLPTMTRDSFVYEFDPPRGELRETVDVAGGPAEVAYMGTGRCVVSLRMDKFDIRTGESRTEMAFDAFLIFKHVGGN